MIDNLSRVICGGKRTGLVLFALLMYIISPQPPLPDATL